ncbi:MAG: riboflavin synthase [Clostridia bacterium]|nr:riboflavin synthase [Clostridia bacterium]
MFTGIIEEIGKISAVRRGALSCELSVQGNVVFDGLKIGDSVAVNGVCLTVTSINGNIFTADVMAESMRRSNLGTLQNGSEVNLERAMPSDGRFGGHIVSGHIDGIGFIQSLIREDNAVWVTITADSSVMRYIVEKGSIAIDGISLTVAKVFKDAFSVSIIPHTGTETTLLSKKSSDRVNLECDIIGKYVEKLIGKSNGITEDFLNKYNF